MSAPRITIDVPLSKAGLLELRTAIDNLLHEVGADPLKDADEGAAILLLGDGNSVEAERKVDEVWRRVGLNIKRFLTLAAQINEGGDEFSMDQIAEGLGVNVKSVRSWQRNLGRTLRQVDEVMPTPELMIARWDGTRNQYQFPSKVRAAILERAGLSTVNVEPRAALRALEGLADSTPGVVISRAHDVLERRLLQILADAGVPVPSSGGKPDVRDLSELGLKHGLLTPDTLNAIEGARVMRNLAVHDPTGNRTTPARAREYLSTIEATLYALDSGAAAFARRAQMQPVPDAHLGLDGPLPTTKAEAVLRVLGSEGPRDWGASDVAHVIQQRWGDIDAGSVGKTLRRLAHEKKVYPARVGRYRLHAPQSD